MRPNRPRAAIKEDLARLMHSGTFSASWDEDEYERYSSEEDQPTQATGCVGCHFRQSCRHRRAALGRPVLSLLLPPFVGRVGMARPPGPRHVSHRAQALREALRLRGIQPAPRDSSQAPLGWSCRPHDCPHRRRGCRRGPWKPFSPLRAETGQGRVGVCFCHEARTACGRLF